jgi:Cytochrome P450
VLKGTTKLPIETFADMQKKYGDVFTFWIGNWPIVFIFDLNLAKEAFNKAVYCGRPKLQLSK